MSLSKPETIYHRQHQCCYVNYVELNEIYSSLSFQCVGPTRLEIPQTTCWATMLSVTVYIFPRV
jgi:hypothetical protein